MEQELCGWILCRSRTDPTNGWVLFYIWIELEFAGWMNE